MGHLLGLYLSGVCLYLMVAIRGLYLLRDQQDKPQSFEWWGEQITGILGMVPTWPIAVIQAIFHYKLHKRREHEAIEAMRENPDDEGRIAKMHDMMIDQVAQHLWTRLVVEALQKGMSGKHAALQADVGVEQYRSYARSVSGHQHGSSHWTAFYVSCLDAEDATELVKGFARRFPQPRFEDE